MYDFKDTARGVSGSVKLPSEAVFINGISLDEAVDGYRTLWVSGREPLEMEYETQKIGDIYKMTNWNQNVRTLTVGYQIMGNTAEDVMDVYNILNSYLNFRDARISFNDEPDKYFVGSKADSDTPESGLLSFTSSFDIICIDPHKYSVAVRTFPAVLNSDGILEATIVNNGTADVPISYEITHNADNGYIGIVSAEGAMEFGKRDELDGEDFKESDLLINATKTFTEFVPDTGPNATNINFATNGELATMEADGRNVLYLKDAGSGGYWHGGQVTCTLPADSQGGIGADKFYSYFNAVFQTGLISQTGLFTLSFLDEDDKNICSYTVTKHITNANLAQAQFWVGDKCYKTTDFYPTMWNRDNQFAAETGHCSITKNGDYFEFYWRTAYNFGVHVPEMADKKCVKVQIYLAQLRNRTLSEADFLGRLFFRELSFMKLNVDKWRNVPNRYSNGDVFSIDGETKRPYLNGMTALDDEVVGTNYFKAPPGTSKVQFYFSGFSDPLPAVKAKIREAWL